MTMIANLKLLAQHKGFMRYFQNTSWLMGEKIIRIGVGFFVSVWIARYLGPEQFGTLNYAQSLILIFAGIATLGLDGIVVRELVKDETQREVILGTAFGLKLIGAILIFPILALALQYTSNDDTTNLLIFIIAAATIFQSFDVIDFYYQSKALSKYIALANTVSVMLSSIFKVVLILNDAPLVAFAIIVSIDALIVAIGLIVCYLNTNGIEQFNWRFELGVAKNLLKDSWPLILGSIAASIYMQIDQIMIMEIMDSKSVGYYAVAAKLSSLWIFITIVVTKSLLPSIISAKEMSEDVYLFRLQYLYNILLKIAFFICVVVTFFSTEIITFLYGDKYLESISILIIYVWSTMFVYLSNASTSYFLAENMQLHACMRLIFGAIINVVLNIYWIEQYGLVGAAYATLISYAFSSYFYNLFFKRTRINFLLQTRAIINIFNIKSYLNITKIEN